MHPLSRFQPYLLLSLITLVQSACPNEDQQRSWEAKLHKDILSNYSYTDINDPCDENLQVVKLFFYVKYMTLNYDETTLTVHSWVAMKWNDPQISWSPASYGNLDEVIVDSAHISVPSLTQLNSIEDPGAEIDVSTPCVVRANGDISCVPRMTHDALCVSDLTNWPYDTQDCTMIIGSYYNISGLNLTFSSLTTKQSGVSISDAQIIDGWFVQSLTYGQEARSRLIIKFNMKRDAEDIEIIIIPPTLVVCFFLFVCLFLNVQDNTRLALLAFCIYIHIQIIGDINFFMPKQGKFAPKILTFLRTSILSNCAVMFISLFLGKVTTKDYPAPIWFGVVNNKVLESKAKYILLTQWRPKIDEEDSKYKFAKEWTDFANIINGVVGFILIILYLSLFIVYLPWPPANLDKTIYNYLNKIP